MAAPKGNKHAVGNAGGPKPKHDRLQILKDFVEFAKDNPNCLTVPMYTTTIGINSEMLMHWIKEDLELRQYYLTAKEYIGLNRLKATLRNEETEGRRLDKTIDLQHVGNFDLDIKAHNREEKEFESKLRSKEVSKQPTTNHFYVNPGLADGTNIQAPPVPMPDNQSPQQWN